MSVAILDKDGGYGAVIVSGANLTIPIETALHALDRLGAPKLLVLQNEIEDEVNAAVARRAKELGALVLLNAAPARELSRALACDIDILVVNRVEAAMMSGKPVSSREEAARAIPELRASGRNVIVTLGGDGLVGARHDEAPVGIAAEEIVVNSTHGAGDCFVAQLAAALANGSTFLEAAVRANATAAAYVAGRLVAGNSGGPAD